MDVLLVQMCVYHVAQYLQKPEEDTRSPRTRQGGSWELTRVFYKCSKYFPPLRQFFVAGCNPRITLNSTPSCLCLSSSYWLETPGAVIGIYLDRNRCAITGSRNVICLSVFFLETPLLCFGLLALPPGQLAGLQMPSVLRGPCLSRCPRTKQFLQISFAEGEKGEELYRCSRHLEGSPKDSLCRKQNKTKQKQLSPWETELIQRNKDNRKILLSGEKG